MLVYDIYIASLKEQKILAVCTELDALSSVYLMRIDYYIRHLGLSEDMIESDCRIAF